MYSDHVASKADNAMQDSKVKTVHEQNKISCWLTDEQEQRQADRQAGCLTRTSQRGWSVIESSLACNAVNAEL